MLEIYRALWGLLVYMEECKASHQQNNPTLKQKPWERVSDWSLRKNLGLIHNPSTLPRSHR